MSFFLPMFVLCERRWNRGLGGIEDQDALGRRIVQLRPSEFDLRAFCKIRSRAGCVAGKSDIVLLTY